MLTAFRWLLRLFVGLIALSLLAGFLAYYVLSRSLPDYSADYALPGLSQGMIEAEKVPAPSGTATLPRPNRAPKSVVPDDPGT